MGEGDDLSRADLSGDRYLGQGKAEQPGDALGNDGTGFGVSLDVVGEPCKNYAADRGRGQPATAEAVGRVTAPPPLDGMPALLIGGEHRHRPFAVGARRAVDEGGPVAVEKRNKRSPGIFHSPESPCPDLHTLALERNPAIVAKSEVPPGVEYYRHPGPDRSERLEAHLERPSGDGRPTLDHEPDPLPIAEQLGSSDRIAVDDDEVRQLPRPDRADEVAEADGVGGCRRRRDESVNRREAMMDHAKDLDPSASSVLP